MRLFDIAGLFFVTLWVVVVAAFVFVAFDDTGAEGIALTDGIIDLQEDTTWMAVYREGRDAGVLREDRTRLIDGWLIELQGIVELELLGDSQVFRFSSRSTLNEDLTLRSATGDIEAFGMELKMTGQYRDSDDQPGFYVNVVLDESSRQFVAELQERPRLANYAIPEILARDDLEVGDRFQQEFFDPLTLAPSHIELVYDGKEEIETVGDRQKAHNFLQSAGSFDTRIYTDDWGMPLVQILPMQVAVRRLPDQLGPSHFNDYVEIFEQASGEPPAFVSAIDADDLLALVARFGSGQIQRLRPATEDDEALFADLDDGGSNADRPSREYTIHDLPDDMALDLMGPRQHIAMQSADRARVESGHRNPLWHAGHAPKNSSYEPTNTPETSSAMSSEAEDITEAIDFDPASKAPPPKIRAQEVLPFIKDHCDRSGDSPDRAVECLIFLADALDALGLPPHFAHGGLVADDATIAPQVWLVLFYDGHYLGAIDPMSKREVAHDHLQLYIDDAYRPDAVADILPDVEVH